MHIFYPIKFKFGTYFMQKDNFAKFHLKFILNKLFERIKFAKLISNLKLLMS